MKRVDRTSQDDLVLSTDNSGEAGMEPVSQDPAWIPESVPVVS